MFVSYNDDALCGRGQDSHAESRGLDMKGNSDEEVIVCFADCSWNDDRFSGDGIC